MKYRSKVGSIILFSLAGLLLFSGLALASGPVEWGYSGDTGPENWGDLSPDFALCGTGVEQSPIDVPAGATVNPADLGLDYQASAVNILNNGHTVQVNYDAGSTLQVDGQTYNLLQFHFHAASENTSQGQQAPLEAHFVHANADGGLAVVGVWLESGSENAAFAPVFDNLPATKSEATTIEGATVDANELLPAERTYYRFNGSLTTPPCSEGVKWFMMSNPVELSDAQIAAFTAIYDDNFRPVQPFNDRSFLVTSQLQPAALPESGGVRLPMPGILAGAGLLLVILGASLELHRRHTRIR